MSALTWHFPEKLEEAAGLLRREGIVPHAGGTGLLMGGLSRLKGLVDLGRLPLKGVRKRGSRLWVGAMCTFTEAAEGLRLLDPGHVLAKALSQAASHPLRNRITVGGSVAFCPSWSDLAGPLLALDAEVELLGHEPLPASRYWEDRGLRRGALVTGVLLPSASWATHYYRHTRVRFDYPTFNITIILKKSDSRIQEARIVLAGASERARRLQDLEDSLKGRKSEEVLAGAGRLHPVFAELVERALVKIAFSGKKGFSPEYLRSCAAVELERGLAGLLELRGGG